MGVSGMLKAKQVGVVLSQVQSPGIISVMLLTQEGALLGSSTTNLSNAAIAAIAANIFVNYSKHKSLLGAVMLGSIIIRCDHGLVAVGSAGHLLVCVSADQSVPLGVLKKKLDVLKDGLEEPLSRMAQ
eukprot:c356_g1_i1.p1 GENE.c356_g1_i1~~c356_g1_i1.p1  ORF type:complete len:128 (-),score=23.69 c356_g1_i1:36-419(-)